MDERIFLGGSVKALGGGKVGGHLILYGDETTPDLSSYKDYFSKSTEYDIEPGDRRGMYWSHGLDPKIGVKKIGTITITPDEHGLWVEGVLDMADKYQQSIYEMAEKGVLGWSSGAPAHLVARKAIEVKGGTVHEITHWPIAEGSLTPTPADYRNQAYSLKSLAAMIQAESDIAPATKSRADFTYDDLRALLEQEWNEDFGGGVMMSGCDSWEQQWHIVAIKDDFCVGQQGWDGELIRRTYTITAGNDVTWGEPAEVARTTAFVTVTDSEDAADAMKTAETDSALESSALTFADHLDTVLAAVAGVIERAEDIHSYRIKAGRAISAANRQKMQRIHQGMQVAHAAMAEHMGRMDALLTETDPDAKKSADEVGALRTQHLRLQSRWIGIA